MSSLLTLEDYNSVNTSYVNEFYTLDTKKISWQEFENVLYDFCRVSHSINGSEHTFTIAVHNSLWCGRYYIEGSRYISNVDYDDATNTITIVTSMSDISLGLWLCNYLDFEFESTYEYYPETPVIYIAKNEINSRKNYNCIRNDGATGFQGQMRCNKGVIDITDITYRGIVVQGNRTTKILCLLKKTDLLFNLNSNVTIGIINHIPLNVHSDYKPHRSGYDQGQMVNSNYENNTNMLDIIVKYGDLEIPVTYDAELNDYCFDLDLTEKINNNPVKLTVEVNEIDLVNPSVHEVSLKCNYPTASSFNELKSLIVNGAEIIKLTDQIMFNSNLIIPHNMYLIADNNTVDLGNYHVTVSENVNLNVEGALFHNGESCFIQKPNSTLTLTECSFVNSKITDNYKGSVVSSNNTSSITKITECTFHNCHHTIYTGGELTVTQCKTLYDSWNDSLDTDYSAFLNAFAGSSNITNSVFDIDYADKTITDEEINYALSLVGLSNECMFNQINADMLNNNNVLPFTNAPYNNLSHIFVPFYHASAESVVVASPVIGRENQSVCHRLLDTDWVYKNNTQITHPNKANTIRKITWEDI